MRKKEFLAGVRSGMPVCVGYFSVSFGFGTAAVAAGIRAVDALLMSAMNLTSAGQFAGITLFLTAATIIETLLNQLVINSRYALMSLSLKQRMGDSIPVWQRAIISFFITDEIFALSMQRKEALTTPYMLGAGLIAALGWSAGTICGALAGSIMPDMLRTAMGVMLYGMFIAIVVPQAKAEKPVLIAVLLAILFSCLFRWVPVLNRVSAGLQIAICAVAAAAICAVLFPVADEETEEKEETV